MSLAAPFSLNLDFSMKPIATGLDTITLHVTVSRGNKRHEANSAASSQYWNPHSILIIQLVSVLTLPFPGTLTKLKVETHYSGGAGALLTWIQPPWACGWDCWVGTAEGLLRVVGPPAALPGSLVWVPDVGGKAWVYARLAAYTSSVWVSFRAFNLWDR